MTTNAPDFRHILKAALAERLQARPSYSLRAFALDLGLSPASMSSILQGKQGLSREAALKVGQAMQMAPANLNYFCDLVELQHARSAEKRELARLRLNRSAAENEYHLISEDNFRAISDWYHFPILELLQLKGFQESPEWIAKALNITCKEAAQALERLLRMGMIVRDSKGKLQKNNVFVATAEGPPSLAIRQFHSQILQKAISAIHQQDIEERSLSANFLVVDKKSLSKAKEKLKRFRRRFAKEFNSAAVDRDSLYCLSLQLFSIASGGPNAV